MVRRSDSAQLRFLLLAPVNMLQIIIIVVVVVVVIVILEEVIT
jgi:hypothetical protein